MQYRVMAIAMMQSAWEVAGKSIDRYVIFSDQQHWKAKPDWIEIVPLNLEVSGDRQQNWSLKPELLHHQSVKDDLLLYIDADSTIYSDVIGRCFDWIEQHSLLVYMNFTPDQERWGNINLKLVYKAAGFDAKNLTINAGILGRKPDEIGRKFQSLYRTWMKEKILLPFFDDPMYQKNDEPYAGLAYQWTYKQLGLTLPQDPHPLTAQDYMLTIGADPRLFHRKPGPVIRVPWCNHDVIRPAIVHWIDNTQYLFFRKTLWNAITRAGFLTAYFQPLVATELAVFWKRLRLKLQKILKRILPAKV